MSPDAAALAVAVDAVTRAGARLRAAAGRDRDVSYKDGVEPVTAADLACERLIVERLRASFPGHRVLSEESAPAGWADLDVTGPLWVIDPVDGTANFARRHPYVSVSVALAVDGVVRVAAVHAPFLGETYTAVRGGGAERDARPLAVARPAGLERAVVSTGFPHRRPDVGPLVERVRRLLVSCQDIRRAASPALDGCWVADGRLDAHTESMAPWDVAAAGLIAVEAGAGSGTCDRRRTGWHPTCAATTS
jgi:myo-inositol-1(or 4)-monophosphatase